MGKPVLIRLFEEINGKTPNNEIMADIIIEQASKL
jgi:hypothetical protein